MNNCRSYPDRPVTPTMSSIAFSPQPENIDYNLRQRVTLGVTLPMEVDAVMKQNFVYRMVFRDIYWLYVTWTERQSAQMSKITNDGLTRPGIGCQLYPCGTTGRQRVNDFLTNAHMLYNE